MRKHRPSCAWVLMLDEGPQGLSIGTWIDRSSLQVIKQGTASRPASKNSLARIHHERPGQSIPISWRTASCSDHRSKGTDMVWLTILPAAASARGSAATDAPVRLQ